MPDKGVTTRLYGNYRAKVVENRDEQKMGRVLVWIPDLMPEVSDRTGIWARPANNPIGGRNIEEVSDHHYMGSCYIPKKGAWVWIMFEAGNINRPYYWGALDIENTTVLPENQLGPNFTDKWTIFKTHEGRTIVMSDDDFDQRVEITGTKRQLSGPPTGNTGSVYPIDGNQTTILLDERDGKQKVLIRTYKGDFFHVDIDERKLQAFFEDDIEIKTNKSFYLTAKEQIHIKSKEQQISIQAEDDDINIKAKNNIFAQAEEEDINVKAKENIFVQAEDAAIEVKAKENIEFQSEDADICVKAKNDIFIQTEEGSIHEKAYVDHNTQSDTGDINELAAQDINNDTISGKIYDQCGNAIEAEEACEPDDTPDTPDAIDATPEGERDT